MSSNNLFFHKIRHYFWQHSALWATSAALMVSATLVSSPVLADEIKKCSQDDSTGNKICLFMDDNSVALKPEQSYYEGNNTITTIGRHSYGMNLTVQAEEPALVNDKDKTRRIEPVTSKDPHHFTGIASNQWGIYVDNYLASPNGVEKVNDGYFGLLKNNVPLLIAQTSPNNNPKKLDVTTAVSLITFFANIDASKLSQGSYSTSIVYTLTSAPKPQPDNTISVCRSGDPKNDCQVDIDTNMIPVKYTGNTTHAEWTSLANREDTAHQGEWYDYAQKQWANAITVKNPSKYKGKSMVVDQSDILGFWVYIPRYAYEVMRRDVKEATIDNPEDFIIHFEKATDAKHTPGECLSTADYSKRSVFYRDSCSLVRSYTKGENPDNSTWATHPAFTFGAKELNGFWMAKFELNGVTSQLTVLPNARSVSSEEALGYIGRAYVTVQTLGVPDANNTGGNHDFSAPSQNSHHLDSLSSRLARNKEWGAASYLAFSRYGAGVNKVQPNALYSENNVKLESADSERAYSISVTGCGPAANGSLDTYSDVGTLGEQSACSSSNLQRAYNGSIGQLASTTGNVYGVYDMSGGNDDRLSASYSDDGKSSATNSQYMIEPAHEPYADLYVMKNYKKGANFNNCTWEMCGGQALSETTVMENGREVNVGQWGANGGFVNRESPWLSRGFSSYAMSSKYHVGIIASGNSSGNKYAGHTVRVVLSPRPI